MTSQNLIRLKLLAALVALGCGIGAIVTVYLLYQVTPPATSAPPASPHAASAPAPPNTAAVEVKSFPSPPSGALVLAREDRDLAVGLAVLRRPGRLALQASVLGPDQPVQGLSVAFDPGGASVPAEDCGPGCYAASIPLPAARSMQVSIRGPNMPASSVGFRLPASLPGAPATALVERAATAWRGLKSLVNHDRLSSGPGATISTVWRFQAPDRYTYEIRNGAEAVSIGTRRWDRLPGRRWQESEQDPIRQPVPLWESVANAHLLGTASVHGRRVVRASFFDPQLHAWFTIEVDPATMHTLDLRMTTTAHFMHEVYGPFDTPLAIVPPKAKASA
jgi:hypothetical protein